MSKLFPEFANPDEPPRDVQTRLGPMSVPACVADRIDQLERACRAAQASPYDEQEYLDAMEAAMGPPPEPGKYYGPGSPTHAHNPLADIAMRASGLYEPPGLPPIPKQTPEP